MASASSYGMGEFEQHRSGHPGLRGYYETIREHIRLVVLCVAVAVAAAGIYVATASKSYTAEAQLLANPAPAANTNLFSLPLLHASGDPVQDILTAANLVTTPQVAHAVIAQLHLKTSATSLLSKVQATPIGQSNLVAVQATGSSPQAAQALANAFVNQVIAVRTAALHKAIASQLPGLRTSVASLPVNQRNGPGSLGEQLIQLEQMQTSNDPTLSIAAPAELPTGPSSPQTKLSLVAGLFAGLILGIGAAFAFNSLDPRVRREEQVREIFNGIPVLARIPIVGRKQATGPLIPTDLSVPAIEAYRTLRTTLSSRAGGEPRAFLLTGCAPSEGKTTSAISLAVALAQGGGRVVLIEADLRRPRFSAALGFDPEYGTEQVLIGEVDLASALVPLWLDTTPIQVLAVRAAGAELADRLSFAVARRLIETAKQMADFVVIDSPPLTAVIDALPLAQFADEVLVVVRSGQTRIAKLVHLEEILSNQGAYPSGIVLVGATGAGAVGYAYGYDYDGEPANGHAPRSGRRVLRQLPERPLDPAARQ